MSTAVVFASPVAASPITSKSNDPDESRRQRGRAVPAVTRITGKDGQWYVPSQTGNGSYRVILNPAPFVPMCTCKNFAEREQPCKHVYAVRVFIEQEANPADAEPVSLPVTEDAPETLAIGKKLVVPRLTYKQA